MRSGNKGKPGAQERAKGGRRLVPDVPRVPEGVATCCDKLLGKASGVTHSNVVVRDAVGEPRWRRDISGKRTQRHGEGGE